jgi:hypothetical protein
VQKREREEKRYHEKERDIEKLKIGKKNGGIGWFIISTRPRALPAGY